MNQPRLAVGDGNLGIWGALSNVYAGTAEQRCWNHKVMNVLDKLPKKAQAQAKIGLPRIYVAESRQAAEKERENFIQWCRREYHTAAEESLERDWERMVTFYQFPQEHWVHLRTTNIVESPFAGLRLRTAASKRYKKVENATAIIWKMLMVAERRFRRLNAPDKLQQVFLGREFKDGLEVKSKAEEVFALV